MTTTVTPILGITEAQAGQAQLHLVVNEAVRILEAVAELVVISKTTSVPPASPSDGDRYILNDSPTGAWVGQNGNIALAVGSTWVFIPPRVGWRAYVTDEAIQVEYVAGSPSGWFEVSSGGGGTSLPNGGTINQVLRKLSSADGDADWGDERVPAGGLAGQVLTKLSGVDYDADWADPTGGGGGGSGSLVVEDDGSPSQRVDNVGRIIIVGATITRPAVGVAQVQVPGGQSRDGVFTTPDLTGFSWTNQGGYSVSANGSAFNFLLPTAGASNRALYLKANAGDFDVKIWRGVQGEPGNYQAFGLAQFDSGTGRSQVFFGGHDGAFAWNHQTYTTGPTFNSSLASGAHGGLSSATEGWLRYKRVGNQVDAYYSRDGKNWISLFSESAAFVASVTDVGFFLYNLKGSGADFAVDVLSMQGF